MMFRAIQQATGVFAWLALLTPAVLAQTPAELLDRLHRVEQRTTLEDDALKPWHLKLSVELYDDKGQPKEKGTIEEWWASKKSHRIVYDFPSYAATEVHDHDGSFRTPGKSVAPYFIDSVLNQVLHPIMIPKDTSKIAPELHVRDFGALKLDCITMQPAKGSTSYSGRTAFEHVYCLPQGKDELLVSMPFETGYLMRMKAGIFQGHAVPVEETIKIGTKPVATAHIDMLRSEPALASETISHDGLEKYAVFSDELIDKVEPGKILNKVQPNYPQLAKINRIAGTVVMAALIDTTGHVTHLEVVTSPDRSLTEAAMDAVRRWTYQPYLINDAPVEVSTTITVNFSLGGPF